MSTRQPLNWPSLDQSYLLRGYIEGHSSQVNFCVTFNTRQDKENTYKTKNMTYQLLTVLTFAVFCGRQCIIFSVSRGSEWHFPTQEITFEPSTKQNGQRVIWHLEGPKQDSYGDLWGIMMELPQCEMRRPYSLRDRISAAVICQQVSH